MSLYALDGVTRQYRLGSHFVRALSGVNLVVENGEFLALAGPSGSGKTTLLNMMGLLDHPDAGTVSFNGALVSCLSEREQALLRRERLGFIFQSFNLIPVLTVYENVEYSLLRRMLPRHEVRDRVLNALNAVGLTSQASQRPSNLSGGQQQRVAIARVLVREPQVVLADEPTAALDRSTGLGIVKLLKGLNREHRVTFVFSTHDERVLAEADRVIHLEDGRMIS